MKEGEMAEVCGTPPEFCSLFFGCGFVALGPSWLNFLPHFGSRYAALGA
jgi:hypothetical protein